LENISEMSRREPEMQRLEQLQNWLFMDYMQ
jgi:hypothetical protein